MFYRNISYTFTILALFLATSISAKPTLMDISKRQDSQPLPTCKSLPMYSRYSATVPMTKDIYIEDWWRYGGNEGIFAYWNKDTGNLYLSAGPNTPKGTNIIILRILSGTQNGDYPYEINRSSECIVKVPLTDMNAQISNYEIQKYY